ncbi:HD domain-containing protein [Acholeplasma hippikon]|uniref:HD-GYP domain-containing protein n=1 Tax=Acholeplasma hippikon TaxID=264636 RepID=A0A449BK17_9MOLU|nr:HD domain-containing protein [Acholeplasma hippikon]VEU82667.1 Uncharacterised protein [Acholeplasma hippikon]
MDLKKPKNKLKGFGKRVFSKFFGFETGIDVTNDVAVLYRRNVVIKNIVFISNILYSLVFFILGFSVANPTTDWLFAVASLPITYSVGKLQNRLINLDKNDLTKQQIAMYVSSFWIFISAVLVYVRIYAVGRNELFETAAYVLIYYSLVQISLYQDKRLLANSFVSLLGFVTLIHIAVTYDFFHMELTWQEFSYQLLNDPSMSRQFGALILRTVIFSLFYLVNYIIVSIGQTIQEERKKELTKRRQVQDDFTHIVKNFFNIVFQSVSSLLDETHAYRVSRVSVKLADYYNLDKEAIERIENYSLLHLEFDEIKDLMIESENQTEQSYDVLRTKTELGARIAKRIQLAKKTIDIIRTHHEDMPSESFINEMRKIQPDIESQIILISDFYVTLRSVSSYYRPYNHQTAMQFILKELSPYIDGNLKDTFYKYNEELNQLYQNL